MPRGHAEATAIIAAPPEVIYAILADYRTGHPQIVPKPYFTKLEVEQGGVGAGTVIRMHMRVVGREIVSQHVISEPEPGRVLVETDLHTDMATTFTLTPLEDGQRAQLQIVTEWEARAGLLGWLEKVVTTQSRGRGMVHRRPPATLASLPRWANPGRCGWRRVWLACGCAPPIS